MRVHEVEQRPQLLEGVLDRSSRQQQPVLGRQLLQLPHQQAAGVLDPLALVDDQVLPAVALQGGAVDDADLRRRREERAASVK